MRFIAGLLWKLRSWRWRMEVKPAGATVDWANELRLTAEDMERSSSLEIARVGRRTLYVGETSEYPIVDLDKIPEVEVPPVIEHKGVAYGGRVVEDELGAWNPDTADWSTPALIFEDLTVERMRHWGKLIPDDARPALVAKLAAQVLCVTA